MPELALSLDANFAPFLVDRTQSCGKTRPVPLRGFIDSREEIQEVGCQYSPAESKHAGINAGPNGQLLSHDCSSHDLPGHMPHHGFQSTGAHLIDFSDIRLEPDKHPEDLYQCLMAFTKDNLLHCYSGITHHGVVLAEEDDYLYLYLYVYLSISLSLYLSISLSLYLSLEFDCTPVTLFVPQ